METLKKFVFLIKNTREMEACLQLVFEFIFVPGAIQARYKEELRFRATIRQGFGQQVSPERGRKDLLALLTAKNPKAEAKKIIGEDEKFLEKNW